MYSGKQLVKTYIYYCFTGAYVPVTMEGNIMVDEVLASCYASAHHDVAHLTMKPMQLLSEIMKWVFGDDIRFPVFVKTTREMGLLFLPDNY